MKTTISILILSTLSLVAQVPTDNLRKLLTEHPELIPIWNNSAIDRSNIILFAEGMPSPFNSRTNLGCCDPVPGVVFMPGAGWPAIPQPVATNHSQVASIMRAVRSAKCPRCASTVTPRIKTYNGDGNELQLKCVKCAKIWNMKTDAAKNAFMAPLQASPPPEPPPPVPFNIMLSDPIESEYPDQVYVFAYTTQLANNELSIESSPNDLFSFAQAAFWGCYPNQQDIAALFLIPKDVDRFYRAVNTPCAGIAPAFAPAAPFISKPLLPKLQKWHTKTGYTLGRELPSKDPKVRLFILKPPAPPKTLPPAPWQ